MREYVQPRNLVAAAILAAVITMMGLPRITLAGLDPSIFVPGAFIGMLLVSAAATAWSPYSGLNGLFPRKKQLWIGILLAAVAAIPVELFQAYLTDPLLRQALIATGKPAVVELRFPSTIEGILALSLWSAGFENMFFCVAPTAYFSRLSRSRWLAIALTVAFRAFVTSRMLAEAGVISYAPLFLLASAAHTAVACFLFAYGGLPASTLFFSASCIHTVLLRPI